MQESPDKVKYIKVLKAEGMPGPSASGAEGCRFEPRREY